MKRCTFEKGFTLIELMVVVGIIGILASVALPSFQAYLMQSRQIEAEEIMRGVYTHQLLYRVENGTYGASEAQIGMTVTGTRLYGVVAFTNVTALTFTATISANLDSDATLDRWRLTATDLTPVQSCNDISDTGAGC